MDFLHVAKKLVSRSFVPQRIRNGICLRIYPSLIALIEPGAV
jgi:hypothetical protein